MPSTDLSQSFFGGWWESEDLSDDKSDVGILCEEIKDQSVTERPSLGNGKLTQKLSGSTYFIETSSRTEELDQVKA